MFSITMWLNNTFLRFCSWNIEGLSGKLNDSDFLSKIGQFDLISLVETWLIDRSALNIDGFYSFSKCRKMPMNARRNSGGITILVKSSLRKGIKFFDKESCDDFVWWKLDKNFFHLARDVFVCSVYIPPQNSPRERRLDLDHFESLQESIYKFASLGEVILCGDFNARMGNLGDYVGDDSNFLNNTSFPIDRRNSRDGFVNAYGKSLYDLCSGNGLIALNGRLKGDFVGQFTCHTYNGASVVDYTIVSHDLLPCISNFSVSSLTEFSHHCFLSFVMKVNVPNVLDNTVALQPYPMSFQWNEDLKGALCDSFNSKEVFHELDVLFSNSCKGNNLDVDSVVNKFTGVIIDTSRKVIPVKRKRSFGKSKPKTLQKQKWFDKSCYDLKRELRTLGNLLSKYPNDPFLRHKFFVTKRVYKKLIRRLKRNFHSELLDKIQISAECNPKEFWNLVNSIKQNHSGGVSGNISPAEWFSYFKNLNKVNFSSENTSNEALFVKDLHVWATRSNEILDKPISIEEVYDLSKRLKNNKASANDSVTNEIIKSSVGILASYFVKLFNMVLSSGVFPRAWSEGFIVPLHKSGCKAETSNYRGICISSCLGKFFTLILNNRLTLFLKENNTLNRCQIGFRPGFRTSDHLLVLKTLIDSYKSRHKPLFACFIDFRKAYDSVWREGLFFKLIKYGCSRKFISILLSMYSSTKAAVKLEQGITSFFQSHIGVKQGCNLSPMLFNIFINDIPDLFSTICDPVKLGDTKLNCLLYADDLVLLSESESGLQCCLRKLEQYTQKWRLKVNLKKSKILIFGTQSQRRMYLTSKWFMGKDQLDCVDEYTYLGITLHFGGKFKLALKTLYSKALRAYNGLLKGMSNIENVPVKVLLKLFSSVIVPILLYGCEIWGVYLLGKISSFEIFKQKIFKVISDLEKLQLKFYKRILGVHSKTTNLAVYGELGRVPLIIQISSLVIKYWVRIKDNSYHNTLVGKAARVCMQTNHQAVLFANYLLKWCQLKSLVDLNIPLEQLASLGKYVKAKLFNIYVNFWKNQIQQGRTGGKLRTYSQVKINFGLERYLTEIQNVNYRQAVTRLRISAHRLPVESGRYKKVPFEERKCKLCNLNEIGDEYHYFMSCDYDEFLKIRNDFMNELHSINSSFRWLNSRDLLLYTLSMHDDNVMNMISKYCHYILTIFNACKSF